MSIKDEIDKYSGLTMFCTPGHKGSLLKDDITEIGDDFPSDCIKRAEDEVAQIIGAKQIRFLTFGSSLGVKAALMGFGDLLVQKNSHKSVLDAGKLSNSNVFFFDNDTKDGIQLPPTKKQIEDAIKKYPSVSTVVLTSPDYYGLTASTDAAKAVISAGKRLHIDAAHGAHFFFRPDLFDTDIFRLAHTFNLSAHKTLPAYTQTAYLAVNDTDSMDKIDENLDLLGTTSPFYPFMAALQQAAKYTLDNKHRFDEIKKAADRLKKRIKCLDNNDFTRIVVDTNYFFKAGDVKPNAKKVFDRLKDSGIIAEKYDERYIIFILTVCDTAEKIDFLAEELCLIRDCL